MSKKIGIFSVCVLVIVLLSIFQGLNYFQNLQDKLDFSTSPLFRKLSESEKIFLNNGVELHLLKDKKLPLVQIMVAVDAGLAHEETKDPQRV